jgi:hypothetical protein
MIELPLYVSYGKQDAAYFALQREDWQVTLYVILYTYNRVSGQGP